MPPPIELARLAIAVLYALVLVYVSVSDIRSRRIPNWTVAAIAVLFVGWAFAGPSVSVVSSLIAAGIVLVVTAALFGFGVIGAGDSKLMSVVALFAELSRLPYLVLVTVVAGGVIALVSLALRPRRALAIFGARGKGDFGRGIPYGVAISLAAALVMLRDLGCSAPAHFRLGCF